MKANEFTSILKSNRVFLLSAWLAFVIVAIVGLSNVTVSSDNRVFYSENNEPFSKLRAFEEKYIPNHNVTILLTKDDDSSFETIFRAIRWLSSTAWKIENVVRVDSIDSYPSPVIESPDEVTLETILSVICPNLSSCRPAPADIVLPSGIQNRLVSADRKSFAAVMTLELDSTDTQQIERIMLGVRSLVSELSTKFPDLVVNYTGGIPMMNAFSIAADQDSATLVPATIITIFLIAWLLLSSASAAAILLAIGISSSLMTMGFAGHFGIVLNPATSIASILILTLVVTSSMHFLSSYLNDSQIYTRQVAASNALQLNFWPVILTTVTSIAGFLSLRLADAPPVGELGTLASIGMLIGAIHIFLIAPIMVQQIKPPKAPTPAQHLAWRLSKRPIKGRGGVFLSAFILLLGLGTFKLSINDDFVRYFDESFAFRQNTDAVSQKLAGPNHLEIDVLSVKEKGIFHSKYIEDVKKLSAFVQNQPIVANVYSLRDIFTVIEDAFDVSIDNANPDEVAQYYLAFELSLKEGQSTTDFVAMDKNSSRISIVLGESDSRSIQNLIENIELWASEHLQTKIIVTGENAPVANLTLSNFGDMLLGIGITLFFASILIAVALRSLGLALICLFCTLLPIAIGFGIWGWVFEDIGLASIVVLAITIGIVVDDAIHFLARYRDIFRSGKSTTNSEAVDKTIRIVGPAILSTSIALATGFLILTYSGFGINTTLGACTAFIILAALVVDLTLLPRLLSGDPENPSQPTHQ